MIQRSTSTRDFNLTGKSPFDSYARNRVGIKRIAMGDQSWRSIEDASDMYMCTYITVQCIAITVRNLKRLLGHRRIFIQKASLEMRDQIRSWDVRSKYTYFPAQKLFVPSFPSSLYSVPILTANIMELRRYIKLSKLVTIYSDNDVVFRNILFLLLFYLSISINI